MTLERYLLRQLVVGMAFAVAGMAFVAVPGILVQAFHKLAGVGMASILGFLPLVLIDLVPYLLPIGFLLALVATYGRMAAENEWTAAMMAGVHPLRMIAPAALLAAAVSGALYFLATEVSPSTKFRQRDYTKGSAVRLLRSLSPGRTKLRFGDFYLSASARDPLDRNRFLQATMSVPEHDGRPSEMVWAEAAQFAFDGATMVIDLTRPRWVSSGLDVRVSQFRVQLDLDQLFETGSNRRHEWRYQTSRELERRLARTEKLLAEGGPEALASVTEAEGYVLLKNLRSATFEVHSRRALAAVCPMFLLLGVSTGLLLRRGSQLFAFATAVGYALAYYLFAIRLGKGLVSSDVVPLWLAAWGATLAGSAVGAVMTWFALRR